MSEDGDGYEDRELAQFHGEEVRRVGVPPWSNLDLPQQQCSDVARAAHLNRSNLTVVPIPPAFFKSSKRRDSQDDPLQYRVPLEPHARCARALLPHRG